MATGTTTPRKPRAPRKSRKKAVAAEPVAPVEAEPLPTEGAGQGASVDAAPAVPDLKKSELIDLVVSRSGVKKRDAKPAIEAALAILGQALAEGRPLNLAPLGKAKHVAVKDKENARIINMRLRQPKRSEISAPTPLDPSAE
ncbi:HU family DNA-binding protein [Pacificoceanicola onchidii]|uniref:HU family DNA-binding protein n=1 Tax=Pacificoceanicola onchidii TaxID=2562685 RepID=UPI0010A2B0C7|nr:HU family DNA-binding protein [Pacificoceanicola onchidii]